MNNMEVMQKATRAAVFFREFIEGIKPGDWVGLEPLARDLPYWMKEAAKYYAFTVQGVKINLIVPNPDLEFDRVTNLFRVFERYTSDHPLLLADDLPPKVRGVLVRLRIPHIVTNKAVFAPGFGVAYGKPSVEKEKRAATGKLSSFGQKIIAAFLLKKDLKTSNSLNHGLFETNFTLSKFQEWILSTSGPIQPSLSTLSRVFHELESFEFVTTSGAGPTRRIQFDKRDFVWTKLLRLETSTIQKKYVRNWTSPPQKNWVLAGESALAKMSTLNDPPTLVIAMTQRAFEEWEASFQKGNIKIPSQGEITIEIWKKDPLFPRVQTHSDCLNPVELALSLRFHTDPRIRISLTEILKRYELNPDLLGEVP